MRIIVPLQGVVQGRGGVFWGSLIPCALFYFLQLYIRQRRPSEDAHNSSSSSNASQRLARRSSRKSAFMSARSSVVDDPSESAYYAGWREYLRNPYDAERNPEGVIQLGLAENQLCLDLLQEWLKSHPEASSWDEDQPIPFKDVAVYQVSHGVPGLRPLLASFLEEVMGKHLSFDAENIVLTAGATAAFEILAFCLGEAGDAFLVPAPYYPGFDRDIKWRSGIELVSVPCSSSEGFLVSRSSLEKVYNQTRRRGTTVRALLITSPVNPVGNVLDATTLQSFLNFAMEKQIHLISDEIYAGSVYKGNFVSVAEIMASGDYDPNLVHIVYGLSKDMGIPGFRLGVIYTSHKKLLATARRLTRFCTVSSHTERLLIFLLQDKGFVEAFLEENKRRLRDRYNITVTKLQEAGIHCAESGGGFFVWIDMRHLLSAANVEEETNLWNKLTHEVKLNLTPGSACHCTEAGWFRLCFTCLNEQALNVALQRIKLFTETFKR